MGGWKDEKEGGREKKGTRTRKAEEERHSSENKLRAILTVLCITNKMQ